MPRGKKDASAPTVKSTKSTKKAAKTTDPVPEPTPAVEVAAVKVTAVVDVDPAEKVAETVAADFTAFMSKLQQASTLMSELKAGFRQLEKKATRELRAAQKASAKRKRKAGNRSPSGFVKPTLISNELASFLGKAQGTEMARTEVTREINAYIRKQGLQDKDNGRKINADKKLAGLLKLKPDEELTYFNLQKYMSPHFAKANKALTDQ